MPASTQTVAPSFSSSSTLMASQYGSSAEPLGQVSLLMDQALLSDRAYLDLSELLQIPKHSELHAFLLILPSVWIIYCSAYSPENGQNVLHSEYSPGFV